MPSGSQDHINQVVLAVYVIWHTIGIYHNILPNITYDNTGSKASNMIPKFYNSHLLDQCYVHCMDKSTSNNILWYSWLINYWIEGGMMKDYFAYKLTM